MRKLKCSLAAGLTALLLSCSGGAKESLKDIAKPYLGVYECTDARVGEQEYLSRFERLHLELQEDGVFLLHYCEKKGKPQTQQGKYRYDSERGQLTLLGGGVEREFPLSEGVLTVVIPLGGRTIHLKFEQK
jgi:hypothetical protein